MIQVLDIGIEDLERLFGVLLAGHLLQLRRHPIEETEQRLVAIRRVLDLLQKRLALAVVVDQLLVQINTDRVRLLLTVLGLLEPDLVLEIDPETGTTVEVLNLLDSPQ